MNECWHSLNWSWRLGPSCESSFSCSCNHQTGSASALILSAIGFISVFEKVSVWHDICLGNVNEGRTQTQGRYAYTIEVEWALNRSTLPIPRRPQMLWIAFAADLACGKVSARADWIFCPFGSCCQENRGIGMLRANVQSSETHFVANSQPPPPTKQKKVQFGLLNVSLNQNGNCIYSDV